ALMAVFTCMVTSPFLGWWKSLAVVVSPYCGDAQGGGHSDTVSEKSLWWLPPASLAASVGPSATRKQMLATPARVSYNRIHSSLLCRGRVKRHGIGRVG